MFQTFLKTFKKLKMPTTVGMPTAVVSPSKKQKLEGSIDVLQVSSAVLRDFSTNKYFSVGFKKGYKENRQWMI